MSDGQIFMNEVSDLVTQQELIEDVGSRLSRIEISWGNEKYTSFLEVSSNPKQELLVKNNSFPSHWPLGDSLKATIFGNNQILGVIMEIKEITPDLIKFHFPKKVFKINRREAFRFKIPGGYEIPVTLIFESTKVKATLIDISVDGIGVWVETNQHQPPMIINKLNFKLEGKEIESGGEIKTIFPLQLNRKAGYKLGIKFTKVYFGGQTLIINYMNRQLSQYSRKNYFK